MQNESGLSYDIFNVPLQFTGIPTEGQASINVYNTFEQLPTYNFNFLKGNWAVSDIHKLFSMNVTSGLPAHYIPSQKIKRADFVSMLVKAIKLPTEEVKQTRTTNKKNQPVQFTFPDVLPERGDFPYIMAAYKAGIASGRGNGMFYPDHALQLEEAVFMVVRALGLSILGLEPTNMTKFVDDADVSDWAKQEMYAAVRMGLIFPDETGRIHPTSELSKAQAAALINGLVQYMRVELRTDYAEHIVNYTN